MMSLNQIKFFCILGFAFIMTSGCGRFTTKDVQTAGNTNIGSGLPDEPVITSNPGKKCATATVTWVPNTEKNLAGYRLHYGLDPKNLSDHVDIADPNATSKQVGPLFTNATYYFNMTAYNTRKEESLPSQTLRKNVVSTCGDVSVDMSEEEPSPENPVSPELPKPEEF